MPRVPKPKYCQDCSIQLEKDNVFKLVCPACFNIRQFKDRHNNLRSALEWGNSNGTELYVQYLTVPDRACGRCDQLDKYCEPIAETFKNMKVPLDECETGACSMLVLCMSKRKYYRDILNIPIDASFSQDSKNNFRELD